MKIKQEIYSEILKVKSKKVITQKDKLYIQLLQQDLSKLDDANKD